LVVAPLDDTSGDRWARRRRRRAGPDKPAAPLDDTSGDRWARRRRRRAGPDKPAVRATRSVPAAPPPRPDVRASLLVRARRPTTIEAPSAQKATETRKTKQTLFSGRPVSRSGFVSFPDRVCCVDERFRHGRLLFCAALRLGFRLGLSLPPAAAAASAAAALPPRLLLR